MGRSYCLKHSPSPPSSLYQYKVCPCCCVELCSIEVKIVTPHNSKAPRSLILNLCTHRFEFPLEKFGKPKKKFQSLEHWGLLMIGLTRCNLFSHHRALSALTLRRSWVPPELGLFCNLRHIPSDVIRITFVYKVLIGFLSLVNKLSPGSVWPWKGSVFSSINENDMILPA